MREQDLFRQFRSGVVTPSEVARVLIWDQIKTLIRDKVIDWELDTERDNEGEGTDN